MTEVQITAIDEDQLDTVLALDVEFAGEMFFSKPLMIKGKVSGIVRSESDLYIDENAVVEADITANVVRSRAASWAIYRPGRRWSSSPALVDATSCAQSPWRPAVA